MVPIMGNDERTLQEAVTAVVREMLGDQKLSWNEFAARSGIPSSSLYPILNDERTRLSVEVIDRMADGLGVNPAELMARADTKRRGEIDVKLRRYFTPAQQAEVERLERQVLREVDGDVSDSDQEGHRRRASGE